MVGSTTTCSTTDPDKPECREEMIARLERERDAAVSERDAAVSELVSWKEGPLSQMYEAHIAAEKAVLAELKEGYAQQVQLESLNDKYVEALQTEKADLRAELKALQSKYAAAVLLGDTMNHAPVPRQTWPAQELANERQWRVAAEAALVSARQCLAAAEAALVSERQWRAAAEGALMEARKLPVQTQREPVEAQRELAGAPGPAAAAVAAAAAAADEEKAARKKKKKVSARAVKEERQLLTSRAEAALLQAKQADERARHAQRELDAAVDALAVERAASTKKQAAYKQLEAELAEAQASAARACESEAARRREAKLADTRAKEARVKAAKVQEQLDEEREAHACAKKEAAKSREALAKGERSFAAATKREAEREEAALLHEAQVEALTEKLRLQKEACEKAEAARAKAEAAAAAALHQSTKSAAAESSAAAAAAAAAAATTTIGPAVGTLLGPGRVGKKRAVQRYKEEAGTGRHPLVVSLTLDYMHTLLSGLGCARSDLGVACPSHGGKDEALGRAIAATQNIVAAAMEAGQRVVSLQNEANGGSKAAKRAVGRAASDALAARSEISSITTLLDQVATLVKGVSAGEVAPGTTALILCAPKSKHEEVAAASLAGTAHEHVEGGVTFDPSAVSAEALLLVLNTLNIVNVSGAKDVPQADRMRECARQLAARKVKREGGGNGRRGDGI